MLFSTPLSSTLFPYTTLFRSFDHYDGILHQKYAQNADIGTEMAVSALPRILGLTGTFPPIQQTFLIRIRSEEHTSELQSHSDIVCRLLLEKINAFIRRSAFGV